MLSDEIDLNLKYRIGLKHFFNINLGIGIIKKSISCFWGSGVHQKYAEWVLVGCGI